MSLEASNQSIASQEAFAHEMRKSAHGVFEMGCEFVRQAPDYGKMFAFLVPGVVSLQYEERPLTLLPEVTVFVELTELGPQKTPSEVGFVLYRARFEDGDHYRIKQNGDVILAEGSGEYHLLSADELSSRLPLLQFAARDILRWNGHLDRQNGEIYYRTGFMDGTRDLLFKMHDTAEYVRSFGMSFEDILQAKTLKEIEHREFLSLQARGYVDAILGKDVHEQYREKQRMAV